MTRVLTGEFHRVRKARVTFRATPPPPPPDTSRRPARVARSLALAHHVQTAIDDGTFANQAAVARALGLTRARITQLLDLRLLAPDVQAAIVVLEAVDGVEPLRERRLRPLLQCGSWSDQRAQFSLILAAG